MTTFYAEHSVSLSYRCATPAGGGTSARAAWVLFTDTVIAEFVYKLDARMLTTLTYTFIHTNLAETIKGFFGGWPL